MKKVLVSVLTVLLLLNAATAHAEHKLLITDVLDAKQFEAEAFFDYGHNSYDFTLHPSGITGKETGNFRSSDYSLSAGLGYGLQLNFSVPYIFLDKRDYTYNAAHPFTAHSREEGWGDFVLGLTYRLLGDSKKGFAVVTGLNVKLNNAPIGHAGTGTTDVKPYIAASMLITPKTRPYAEYTAIIRNHGADDEHIVTAGVEYEINKTFTLKPSLNAEFRTGSDTLTAYNSYFGSIESYIQVYRNLYLLPQVSAGVSTSSKGKNGRFDNGTLKFEDVGVGLYYYYN